MGLMPLVCQVSYVASQVIIVNMWTAGHRTPDAANDFIFCPMLLCIALDRQQDKRCSAEHRVRHSSILR